MKIACPKCGREYRLDPSRIPAKGARFTCWGCQAKVEVRPVQTGQLGPQADESSKGEVAQPAAAKPPAVAAAMPTPKAQPPVQSPGKLGKFDADPDTESFITGPGVSRVKDFLSTPKSAEAGPPPEPKKEPLKITCPKCKHEYRLDPARIPSGGGKFTCRNCQARIEVRPVAKATGSLTGSLAGTGSLTGALIPTGEAPVLTEADKDQQKPPAEPTTVPSSAVPTLSFDLKEGKPTPVAPPAPSGKPALESPFSFDLPKPAEAAKPQEEFNAESTLSMGSPFPIPSGPKPEPPPVKGFSFDFGDALKSESKPVEPMPAVPPASPSPWDLTKPVEPALDRPMAEVAAKPVEEELAGKPKMAISTDPLSLEEAMGLTAGSASAALTKTEAEPEPKPPKFDLSFKLGPDAEAPKIEEPKAPPKLEESLDPFATKAMMGVQKPTPSPTEPKDAGFSFAPPASPFGGAVDGQKTTPFNFDFNAPTAEGPALAEPGSEAAKGLGEVAKEPSKEAPKEEPKPEESPFGLSAKPTKVGIETISSPAPRKTSEIGPPTQTEDKPLSTLVSKFAADSSFKDLFADSAKGKTPEPSKPPEPPKPPKPPRPVIKEPTAKLNTPAPMPAPKIESKPEPLLSISPPAESKPEAAPDLLHKPLHDEPAPVRFVYHADQDVSPPEEAESAQPVIGKGDSRVRVALWGGLIGLVAAAAVIAGAVFYFKKPAPKPGPPRPQIAQNIPAPGKVGQPQNTGATGTATTPTPPGKTTKPEPTKPEPAKPEKPEKLAKPEPVKPTKPEPAKPTKPEPAKPEKQPVSAGSGTGNYEVQVGASPSEAEAKALGNRVQAAGFQTRVFRADLGSKGIWYRVRINRRFETSNEAKKLAAELKAKGFDCFVGTYQ